MGDVKYSYFEIQNEEAEAGHHWLRLERGVMQGFMMIESEMSRQVSDMININITVL